MVGVEVAYQVWRVAKVLSMGKVGKGVPKKAVKSTPEKILRKCHFIFSI